MRKDFDASRDRRAAGRDARRFAAWPLAAVLLAGCWSEVDYDDQGAATTGDSATDATAAEGEATTAAPPFVAGDTEPEAEPAAAPTEGPEPAAPQPVEPEPEPKAEQTTAATDAPARLPWEVDDQTAEPAATPEAQRLFAQAEAPLNKAPEADPPASEPAQPDPEAADDFGDFLDEAYADDQSASPTTPQAAKIPPAEPAAPAKSPPTAEELFGKTTLPADPAPAAEEPKAAESEPQRIVPAVEPLAPPAGPQPDAVEPKPPVVEPNTLWPDDPRDEAAVDPTPEPVEIDPETVDPPAEPLRIDPENTRRAAWLLGAKWGLAGLADLDGATSAEREQWAREANDLAATLGVPAPPLGAGLQEVQGPQRVLRVIGDAAAESALIAERYGDNHAALVELALKSNALVVVLRDRPDLAKPVADALATAARRAELPADVWLAPIEDLGRSTDGDAALEAVTRLHTQVEAHLR